MSELRTRMSAAVGTAPVEATRRGAERLAGLRRRAEADYPPMDEMRDLARTIRLHTLAHLDRYLSEFCESARRVGTEVHLAADAGEANSIVESILRAAGARTVVKSKSMLTEEIGLNHALDGFQVTETDLGEFIVQIAEDRPSHIIAPVMHRTRQEIGRLFADVLGVPYTDDPRRLNDIARSHLRRRFLEADAGITGANFAVASTGSVVLVTNEGNGRMCTSLPPVHIALVGIERVVPSPAELAVLLEVLARSATGQRLSVYTTVVTGPRRPGEEDGPVETHVVLVDNGRSRVLASEHAEILACIRCGACLNVCPVYREVGGHAYGGVYPGPVGAVLQPALGVGSADLPFASSLCGACREACPVRIDIPRLLVGLRHRLVDHSSFSWLGLGLEAYSRVASNPTAWRLFLSLGSFALRTAARDGWVGRLPFHASAWTAHRDLPGPGGPPFRVWWRNRNR